MDDKICDVGQYCNAKIMKCVKNADEGESCEDYASCKFG